VIARSDAGPDRPEGTEWDTYTRKDGTIRWSQPLSKAWQYVKTKLKLDRADLTLYSTRRLMADWLDNEAIAQRTRDRILGHASDVRGRKGILDPKIAARIEAPEPTVIKQMRNLARREEPGGCCVLTCRRRTESRSSLDCSERCGRNDSNSLLSYSSSGPDR
jgi:hypothetical protein